MGQKITPNLWFDGAKEAVEYYLSIFPQSKLGRTTYYPESQEAGLADFQLELAGKELAIDFEIGGQDFTAINAGPTFKFNPSVSFVLNFDPASDEQAEKHLYKLWEKLIDGGEALMPLEEHTYSQLHGWVKDRYGLTWQLILSNPEGEPRPFILPALLFSERNTNRAEKAIHFYTSVFKNSRIGKLARHTKQIGTARPGSLMFADFMLAGQWFVAMDSGVNPSYLFNEAISFAVECGTQEEIDYFWEKLSSVPEAEQCGWCKDTFGVSWQILPANMEELMRRPDAFAKMMQMKKLVIDEF